jgi:hypothetical protein
VTLDTVHPASKEIAVHRLMWATIDGMLVRIGKLLIGTLRSDGSRTRDRPLEILRLGIKSHTTYEGHCSKRRTVTITTLL